MERGKAWLKKGGKGRGPNSRYSPLAPAGKKKIFYPILSAIERERAIPVELDAGGEKCFLKKVSVFCESRKGSRQHPPFHARERGLDRTNWKLYRLP